MQKRSEKGREDLRVISSNGEFDFPYEQIVVQRNENIVLAIPISNGALTKVLGEYETPEKAERAMKMLREEWNDYEASGSFRFPKNSEVVV